MVKTIRMSIILCKRIYTIYCNTAPPRQIHVTGRPKTTGDMCHQSVLRALPASMCLEKDKYPASIEPPVVHNNVYPEKGGEKVKTRANGFRRIVIADPLSNGFGIRKPIGFVRHPYRVSFFV